jgi:hypothetical protein
MTENGTIADELTQIRDDILDCGRFEDHVVGYTGELGDEWRNFTTRIDQRRPLVFDPVAIEAYRTDLDDGVFLRVKTSGLDIQGDDGIHAGDYTRMEEETFGNRIEDKKTCEQGTNSTHRIENRYRRNHSIDVNEKTFF